MTSTANAWEVFVLVVQFLPLDDSVGTALAREAQKITQAKATTARAASFMLAVG